jgi:hypothetical protein
MKGTVGECKKEACATLHRSEIRGAGIASDIAAGLFCPHSSSALLSEYEEA